MPSETTGKITRRSLLLGAGATASAVALGEHTAAAAERPLQPAMPGKSGRILNAYYLAANAYTVVPRRVREDMTWMASIGTTAVSISVLEQDFDSANANIRITVEEAKRAGITPYAVPSRWGSLVAGAPSVPSNFTETHSDTWVTRSDGTPYTNSRGHRSDPNHPKTIQFFQDSVERLLTQWPFEGVIWDEPKENDAVDLFRQASEHAKAVSPDVTVALFLDLSAFQGASSDDAAEQFARIGAVDYFGCDGSPWGRDDPADQNKVLLGGDGERFISMARSNGKRSFLLAETYALAKSVYPLVDKRFPEVVDLGSDCLSYYYYPRDVEDPDQLMDITRKHVRNYAA
ncbi:MAG: hypothetical protein J2P24_14605 [Streptosporangiales bacterium]|nr:hypothetical protein [Streptosporangiales bacterium]MBO0890889.1 hypothetical protein [Acidothermales bacterium]